VLPDKKFTAEDILGILIRRRWLVLVPFAIGLFVAPFVMQRMPKIYRSETLIMVVPQRVPDSYVKSTVTSTVDDRLVSISDQILSRSRLERIINDFDLYKEQRRRAPMEDVVRQMRADIGSPQILRGAQSFRISYSSQDPMTAQRVTARLASLFIDESNRDRENLAESTNVFLESQLEDAKQRLMETERRLEQYRRIHAGELPSQLESNLRAIQTAQLQLQTVSEQANRASERRLLVERQLVDAQTLPVALTPSGGAGVVVAVGPSSLAQQLADKELELEALKLKLTAEHPERRRLERTISDLKVRVAEEAKRPAPVVERVQSPAEQVRQRRIGELQADLDVIDHQLSVNQTEQARLKALIADYQLKVDAVPKRESELVELTRDYDVLKKTYDSLVSKREESQLAANLERRQIGEQFRTLDSASLPARPSNQLFRVSISFSGAVVGLLLGLLAAAALTYRDSSFAREEEVVRLLELPVLAIVPTMASAAEQRRHVRRMLAMDAAGVTVLVVSSGFVMWRLLGQ
jgi:polysaccharide chain length determinant protein (PEP-CTERM system associated)